MYFENHLYGHAEILGSYVRRKAVASPPPIFGFLQHGWTPTTQYVAKSRYRSALPRFVWSSSSEQQSRNAGVAYVQALGAPFCYLHSLSVDQVATPDVHPYSLLIPYHEGGTPGTFRQDHRSLALEVAKRYPSARIMVLLFIKEYSDPGIVYAYHDVGFDIACNGHRDDPLFLRRMYRLLVAADRVITNRVATALWYALYLRRPIAFLDGFGGPLPNDWFTSEDELVRRWPFLTMEERGLDEGYEEACRQLGADRILSPTELRRALGWSGILRPTAARALSAWYRYRAPMPPHGSKIGLQLTDAPELFLPAP